MARAVRFAEWAAKHARYALSGFTVATAGKIKIARAVFGWLQRERREEVTARDVHQALRTRYPTRADLQPGLDELVERGALVRKNTKPSSKGGPAKEVYLVNPRSTLGSMTRTTILTSDRNSIDRGFEGIECGLLINELGGYRMF
jgi:hypothetical protein